MKRISYDFVTIKYNSAGVQQWIKKYNGLGNSDEIAVAIEIDASENIISGNSRGTDGF
jgi:hypothetical protein